MAQEVDYGVFSHLVSTVGTLVAAVAALGLAWRGRSKWEPSEQDVDSGAQKVGALLCVVGLAVMRGTMFTVANGKVFVSIAMYGGALALISLLSYGIVTASLTYDRRLDASRSTKVIGGLWLQARVRALLAKEDGPRTVQEAFAAGAYDPDLVWPRSARALAKAIFTFCYIALIVSGTSALAASGFIIDLHPLQ